MGCLFSKRTKDTPKIQITKSKFNGPRFKIRFGSKKKCTNHIKLILPKLDTIRGIRSVVYTFYINNKPIKLKMFYYHSIDGTKSIQLMWNNNDHNITNCEAISLMVNNSNIDILMDNTKLGFISFDNNISVSEIIDLDIYGEYINWNFNYNIICPIIDNIYTHLIGYQAKNEFELFHWNTTKTRTSIMTTSECIDKSYILVKKIDKFIPYYTFIL